LPDVVPNPGCGRRSSAVAGSLGHPVWRGHSSDAITPLVVVLRCGASHGSGFVCISGVENGGVRIRKCQGDKHEILMLSCAPGVRNV
jgi:hypothetical protein